MSDSTPYFPENISEYAPWVAMHGLLQPYGKCQCGCGNDAPLAKCTRKPKGMKQGKPARFIHAHGGRVQEHPSRPIEERFWEYVIRGDPDDCWQWSGPVSKRGYALLTVKGFGNRACRISYVLHYGTIPDGLWVLHKCDNPPCNNPKHLFLGTSRDNVDDMVAKRRHQYGETHWKSKLTESDIIEIRELRAQGMTQIAIGKRYGVSQANISRILLGKNWTHST